MTRQPTHVALAVDLRRQRKLGAIPSALHSAIHLAVRSEPALVLPVPDMPPLPNTEECGASAGCFFLFLSLTVTREEFQR
jgi:hypothetical protein